MLIEENKLPPSDMGVRDPLLPSGTPPPLGKSAVLYHGSIVTPFLRVSPSFTPPKILSAGTPIVPPLKGDPPFRGTPDAIDALRNNRYTFGAARRDWRGAQQSLDLRFRHFYPLSYTRSENERASQQFRRNEERSERLRIFTTRRGAIARQASRPPQSGVERRLRADCDEAPLRTR